MRAAPELTKTHLLIYCVVCLIFALGAIVHNMHDPFAKPTVSQSVGQPIAKHTLVTTADAR